MLLLVGLGHKVQVSGPESGNSDSAFFGKNLIKKIKLYGNF